MTVEKPAPFGAAAVMGRDFGGTWDFEDPWQLALSSAACTWRATTRELKDGSLCTVDAQGGRCRLRSDGR